MSEDTVLAIWIEKDSGEYRVETMGPDDLRSRSFHTEITTTLASDPIEITIIPLAELAEDWAQDAIVRLRALSADIKAQPPTTYFC